MIKTLELLFLSHINLRLRLIILLVGVFGVTLIIFSVLTLKFLFQSLQKEFDEALYNYAVDVLETIHWPPPQHEAPIFLKNPQVDRDKIYPFLLGTALIQIVRMDGTVVHQVGKFENLRLPFASAIEKLKQGADGFFYTLTSLEGLPTREAESYRVVNFLVDSGPKPFLLLQIAAPLTLIENQIFQRVIVVSITIPLMILLSILFCYLLASHALSPINEMIQKAKLIGASKLADRLPVPLPNDEVRSLAVTLNEMLSRIENAFLSQERFVADASHQLLTPLTLLRGELERIQREKEIGLEPRIPIDDSFHFLIDEVEHLTHMVKNMLLLAQMDAGLMSLDFSPILLDEVLLEAIKRCEKLTQNKGIKLRVNLIGMGDVRPTIKGDENLLLQLIFNLLENAIKYSPQAGQILVTLEYHSQHTPPQQHLRIEDSGPGILPKDLPFLFDRFHRGTLRKDLQYSGFGLGLAIGRKITEVHGGRLWAENRPSPLSGACFHLVL